MAAKKKKSNAGRPTKFDPLLIPKVKKFMLMTATIDQLADFLEVDRSQVYRWMEKEPKFRDAVNSGREEADANVASSMYRRAVGGKVKKTKIMYDKDIAAAAYRAAYIAYMSTKAEGEELTPAEIDNITKMATEAATIRADYTEEIPADVKAGIFWLTNRKSEHWKERQQVDQNIVADVQHVIEWVEAPDCEPLKTAEELQAEEDNLNLEDADAGEDH